MKRTLIIFLVGAVVGYFILKKMRGIAGDRSGQMKEIDEAL